MAVLKNGTTIGGNAAIHAANMADHGIITTSTVGSQSVNYATSAGNSATTSQRSYDYLYASSYLESSGAVYGTIFYDNNDREYYVDPNGTSRVSTLNVVSTLNTGNVIMLGYNIDGSISTSAFRGINFHTTGDLNYYIGKPEGSWTQPLDIHFYTGIRLKSHGSYGGTRFINISSGNTLMTVGDGTDYVKVTEKLQVSSTMNINYDQVWTSSGNLHLQYSGSGNIDMNYGGGYTFSRTSLRAPIFYDFEDTGYYLDPNSSGVALRISGAIQGNHVDWTGDHNKIQWHSDHMYFQNMRDGFWIFRKSDGAEPFQFHASGYVNIVGSSETPINITGSGHKYLTINPGNGYEAMVRYVGGSGSGWYVGKRTSNQLVDTASFHFYSEAAGATVGGITIGGDMYASGSMRAPIFYDSNDTTYFCDPNGYSNFWGLAIRGDQASTSGGNQIFLWSGGNTTTSAIGFKAVGGVWAEHGATSAAYNTYFTMDTANRGWIFRRATNGGSDWTGVNVASISNTGHAQFDGSVRSPIFYDSNDTSYYVDPNGASNLKTVTFNSSGANSDVLAVNGVNGRLFTVSDDLSNSLFSVNTIAGLPAMEVFADNKIVLGKYGTTAPSNYINSTLIIKDAQENASAQTLGLIGSKSAGAAIGFFTNDLGYPYPDDQARFAQISLNNGNWEFYSGGGIPVIFNQSPVLLSERIEVSGVVYAWDRLAVNTDNLSYTATDNTPVVGSTTNNKVFISGSIQLINDNDAIVFGRGTSTFLKDEELAFGWGGGWYMVEGSYIRSRNGKSLHMNGGSIDYVGSLYLEGSGTGGHLQPNAGSYGTLQITGSKNSWAGLRFAETAVTLMMNTNESGHHNDNYGWQFRWTNGTLYCHKNSYGGGTAATVLDSSNFTSWAAAASHSHSYVPLSGGTLSGNLLTHDVFPTEDRVYDLGRDTGRYRIVYCETLDSAGLHETNLESEGLDQLETGTVLVWKGGKNLPCTIEADHMRMGVAVYGHNAPLVQGAEPVLCTGEVNEGDYLITSAKEGHAKAVNRAYIVENQLFDCVLGKALETASGESHLVKTWITI